MSTYRSAVTPEHLDARVGELRSKQAEKNREAQGWFK